MPLRVVVLPQDASLQDRVRKHQTRRQDILLEMGALRRRAELPLKTIGARQVDAFARVLRGKLLGNKSFAKQYLRTLVTEIRVDGEQVRITGSNAALAQAVAQTKTDARARVPTFDRIGSPTRARTWDLRINRAALAQLVFTQRFNALRLPYSVNFRRDTALSVPLSIRQAAPIDR